MDFDFVGARKAGATDDQIAKYLADNYADSFDFGGAFKAGADPTSIVDYLATKYAQPEVQDVNVGAEQDNPLVRGYNAVTSSVGLSKDLAAQNYQSAAENIAEQARYQKSNPGSEASIGLQKAWQEGNGIIGGLKNVNAEMSRDVENADGLIGKAGATGENLQAMGSGIIAQIPNMVLPMAGMVGGGLAGSAVAPGVGTVGGAWAGATAGNAVVGTSEAAMRHLQKAGIDPEDTQAVAAYLQEHGGAILGETATKGAVIGAVDTATMGIGSKILGNAGKVAVEKTLVDAGVDIADKAAVAAALKDPAISAAAQAAFKSAKTPIAGNLAAASLEPVGEYAGEYLGSLSATGEASSKDAFLEAVSSLGQSGITFAGQKIYAGAKMPFGAKPIAEQESTTKPQPSDILNAESIDDAVQTFVASTDASPIEDSIPADELLTGLDEVQSSQPTAQPDDTSLKAATSGTTAPPIYTEEEVLAASQALGDAPHRIVPSADNRGYSIQMEESNGPTPAPQQPELATGTDGVGNTQSIGTSPDSVLGNDGGRDTGSYRVAGQIDSGAGQVVPAQSGTADAVEEPKLADGMTRLYHGSATHGRYSGKAWFSTNKEYAQNYREGAELQYVDVPTARINKIADQDGYGQTPDKGFTFNAEFDSNDVGVRKPLLTNQPAQSMETRDATEAERIRASGKSVKPFLNLDETPTGWKRIEGKNNDSVTLVSIDGKKAVTFKSADTKSGTASARMNAEAHAYAIDNPYSMKTPQGELEVKPVFQGQQPTKSRATGVNPATDSLLTAIQKIGVNPNSKDATDIRTALGLSGKQNTGGMFRKDGVDGYDGLALALFQLGYINENDATLLYGDNGKIATADTEYSNSYDPSIAANKEQASQMRDRMKELGGNPIGKNAADIEKFVSDAEASLAKRQEAMDEWTMQAYSDLVSKLENEFGEIAATRFNEAANAGTDSIPTIYGRLVKYATAKRKVSDGQNTGTGRENSELQSATGDAGATGQADTGTAGRGEGSGREENATQRNEEGILTSYTNAEVLKREADKAKAEEDANKDAPAKNVTADQPDLFNTQDSLFNSNREQLSPEMEKAIAKARELGVTEDRIKASGNDLKALTKEIGAAVMRMPSAKPKSAPVASNAGTLETILDQYENTGEINSADELADRIEALEDLPTSVEEALKDYRREQEDDRELSGRNDMDAAEAKLISAIRGAESSTAQAGNVKQEEQPAAESKQSDAITQMAESVASLAKSVEALVKKDEPKSNTEDAGAELTANKRNKLNRGLKWDDIQDKEAALRVKEVVKAKVYPKPDYQALIDGGMKPFTAHMVKQVYDSIAAKPSTGVPNDDQLQAYIDGVNHVMSVTMEWANDKEAQMALIQKGMGQAASMLGKYTSVLDMMESNKASVKSLLDRVYPDGWRASRSEIQLLGGNRMMSKLQPGYDEAHKAIKEIEAGWPASQEAWQKQGYKVVHAETSQITYYSDKDSKGNPYVAVQFAVNGKRIGYEIVKGASSQEDAAVVEKAAEIRGDIDGKYLVLSKRGSLVTASDTEEGAIDLAREQTKREGKEQTVSEKGIKVENAQRTGEARRMEGENVTSEKVLETFGFKGINFGNWMKGKANETERQLHLNHIYDAFLDLAEILNVPPKAVSLNGMLGVAVGAQGNGGGAAAHFVPGVNEINLTREYGAGSLAHEWAHAVDHYFARQAGLERQTDPFLTEFTDRPTRITGEIRHEIVERFKAIVQAMNKRPLSQEEYEVRLKEGLEDSEKQLVKRIASVRHDFEITRAESKKITKEAALAKFDALAAKMIAGDVGDGRIALGSFQSVTPVVDEMRNLYKQLTGRIYDKDGSGWLQGRIDSVRHSKEMIAATGEHVPQMVGSNYQNAASKLDKDSGKSKAYWNTDLEKFARAFDAFVTDQLEAKNARNDYLGHTGRDNETVPQGTERETINNEFAALVQTIETKETDQGVALFNTKDEEQPAPAFYSQLARSIEAAPDRVFTTGKATAAWLQSNTSKLGIKKDEMVWSGITDYLNTQGKVTKADVLAYLDGNGVQIQDVILGDVSSVEDQDAARKVIINIVRANDLLGYDYASQATNDIISGMLTIGDIDVSENERAELHKAQAVFKNSSKTEFAKYQLPGGENYRELLLTLPLDKRVAYDVTASFRSEDARNEFESSSGFQQIRDKIITRTNGNSIYSVSFKGVNAEEKTIADNLASKSGGYTSHYEDAKDAPLFRSSHYTHPNIAAHVRFNERTDSNGKRVLFLEEIQSDFGQQGKKKGFGNAKRFAELRKQMAKYEDGIDKSDIDAVIALNEIPEYAKLAEEARAVNPDGRIPAAPFVTDTKSWTALALKRMIAYAAANGFDSVAWTTGEQQSDRYSLAKQIDSVVYGSDNSLVAYDKSGNQVIGKTVPEDDLEDHIGKEVAKKLIETKPNSDGEKILNNADLKVGGEGMKVFYNQIVPQVANDILKKIGGGKVDAITLPSKPWKVTDRNGNVYLFDSKMEAESYGEKSDGIASKAGAETQPGFTITSDMRAKVLGEGLPLFNRAEGSPTIDTRGDYAHHATYDELETLRSAVQRANRGSGANQILNSAADNGGFRNAKLPDSVYLGRIAAAFGKKVVGIESRNGKVLNFNGVTLPRALPQYVFLSKDADRPHMAILGHELVHHLRNNYPELYLKFSSAVRPYINEKYPDFAKKFGDMNDAAVMEEFMGEVVSDGFMQPAFWEALGKRNPSLLQRIGQMVRELFQKAMRAMGYTNKTEKFISDFDAVMRIAGDVMGEYGLNQADVFGETSLMDEAKFNQPQFERTGDFLIDGIRAVVSSDEDVLKFPNVTATTIKGALEQTFGAFADMENPATGEANKEGWGDGKLKHYGFVTHGDGTVVHTFSTPNNESFSVTEHKDGQVHINVSQLLNGGFGQAVYIGVADYAKNSSEATGKDKVFVADSAGLTDESLIRRTTNMLSVVARHGTAKYIMPGEEQLAGDAKLGVPPLKWGRSDIDKTRALAQTFVTTIQNNVPDIKDVYYDYANSGFYSRKHGTRLPAVYFKLTASNSEAARAARAGESSIRRAVFLQSLMDSESKSVGERESILGELSSNRLSADERGVRALFNRKDELDLQGGKVGNADGSKGSLAGKIVGNSGRQYTKDQMAAMQRTGSVVTKKSIKDIAKNINGDAWKRMAQGLADQFRPVRDIDEHAYTLLRLSKGATGAFEAFMQYGKLSIKDGATDADQTGGVLENVFFPLGGETTDFLRWIAGNRAERLKKVGREHLFTDADIAAFKSLSDGQVSFDYTMADGTVTRERQQIYADSLKKFNGFSKNILDIAEQSGLIDKGSRALWEHEFYVPFYRVAEEVGKEGEARGMFIKSGVLRQEAFKKLKGGDEQLNDLLANTLMNWMHLIDASAKNRAALATLEAAEKVGAARKAVAGDTKTSWVMKDGQKVEYKVEDQYLVEALSALEFAGIRGTMMDILSKPKHWLTIGVTASPFFKVRNLIRDSVQAIGTASNSDLSYNPLANVSRGFKLTNRKNPAQEYVSALAGGGLIRFGTMLEGNEASRTRQLIKQGAKDEHILDDEGKIQAFYDKWIEPTITAYNELGNRGEEVNRMALYDQMIKDGVSHAEAALAARDLMDFSMQGSWKTVRFLSQLVPFMNARIQGMYKLGRAASEDKARFAIVLGATAMVSLALLAMYGDDDDWKKREDWDRDNYWWFKIGGIAYRIPKPFEIGAIATLAERTAELMFDDEMTGERFKDVTTSLVANQLAMNPVPQTFKPISDLYANTDSFTKRPIEPMGLERVDSSQRYTQSTSMIARGVSTAGNAVIGESFLSPVQIDFLVRSYFGWMGATAVSSADMLVRSVSDGPTKPAVDQWKLATGGMVSELSSAQSRYISMMYDQAAELEQAHATYNRLRKEGKIQEAAEYRADNKEELSKYKRTEAVKKSISTMNERVKIIERSNRKPDEKKMLINQIRAKQNEIAKTLYR